jgi:hypothetical protein
MLVLDFPVDFHQAEDGQVEFAGDVFQAPGGRADLVVLAVAALLCKEIELVIMMEQARNRGKKRHRSTFLH